MDTLAALDQPNYANGFKLTLHDHMLKRQLAWKQPMLIFVNSLSDLFHRDVPLDFIQQVFAVMRQTEWHRFRVLTKTIRTLNLGTKLYPLGSTGRHAFVTLSGCVP